eukprot:COSAG01_NODE_20917_length_928_cov_0.845597_1_plen_229_part_10
MPTRVTSTEPAAGSLFAATMWQPCVGDMCEIFSATAGQWVQAMVVEIAGAEARVRYQLQGAVREKWVWMSPEELRSSACDGGMQPSVAGYGTESAPNVSSIAMRSSSNGYNEGPSLAPSVVVYPQSSGGLPNSDNSTEGGGFPRLQDEESYATGPRTQQQGIDVCAVGAACEIFSSSAQDWVVATVIESDGTYVRTRYQVGASIREKWVETQNVRLAASSAVTNTANTR